MLHHLAEVITISWVEKQVVDDETKECYIYGLEILLSGIVNVAVILILSLITNSFFNALIFLAVFIPLRQFTGGYHADNYIACNVGFSICYLLNVLISKNASLTSMLMIFFITVVGGYILIGMMGPVSNPNKLITEIQKEKNKKMAIILFSIEWVIGLLLMLFTYECSATIMVTLLEINILLVLGKIKYK